MTAAEEVYPWTSGRVAAMMLRALLKRRCCSMVGSKFIRSCVSDHEKTEKIYSDKKDVITKTK